MTQKQNTKKGLQDFKIFCLKKLKAFTPAAFFISYYQINCLFKRLSVAKIYLNKNIISFEPHYVKVNFK